ncbi:MAG: hypothetical protein ACXVLQ_10515 [Bacteriovorax sp.]
MKKMIIGLLVLGNIVSANASSRREAYTRMSRVELKGEIYSYTGNILSKCSMTAIKTSLSGLAGTSVLAYSFFDSLGNDDKKVDVGSAVNTMKHVNDNLGKSESQKLCEKSTNELKVAVEIYRKRFPND